MEKIGFTNLKAQYQECKEEIDAAVQHVWDTNNFITGNTNFDITSGSYRDILEKALMEYTGAENVAACGSGTTAIHIALKAIGVGPGDEVIVPSHTFVATPEPIALLGADIVFVDIDNYYHANTRHIEGSITEKTKAILFVDIYGQTPDIEKFVYLKERYGLYLIEDMAQAFSAEYKGHKTGAIPGVDLATVSFNPVKNLGAMGDAGAVFGTYDLVEEAKIYRDHGRRERWVYHEIGYNCRIDNVQAAILCAKLPYVDKWMDKKREICRRYNEELKDIPGVIQIAHEVPWGLNTFYVYNIQVERRDKLIQFLDENGIATNIHFRYPVHASPAFAKWTKTLPVTESVAKNIISLPSSQHLTEEQQSYIIEKITEFYHIGLKLEF